ncbi:MULTISPECIES: hypothetical protein [Alteromonadaceae]|uniref:Uncharacterized protein n=1 Tax=Brumicola blandensis TaxID=3075611 RepID=A0AAW8R4G9_9ALTE|nr:MULTISPECIES: hypothetical protein [unclassified Alteromonas]MDT0584186.1 hypothetical protein [Alteromonas sp. W409]MDT0629707.1 hypothetical protein [Alteromonas sp. W364]
MKKTLVSIVVLTGLLSFSYYMLADQALKPQASAWLNSFAEQMKNNNNASVRLLSLGKSDPSYQNTILETYHERLEQFNNSELLSNEKAMQYPNVSQFEPFLSNPLFCNFTAPDCFPRLNENSDYLGIVLTEFQPELLDFMSLIELDSFEAANPFIAELNLDNLIFLYKLKGTEIYFDIENNNIQKAMNDLKNLIALNRVFFEKSDDLLNKISFSINAENVFQALLIKLKRSEEFDASQFTKVLQPLSLGEMSVNQIQVRSYAKNARLIKAGLAARKVNTDRSMLSRLWHRIIYKENMTLNSMFDDYLMLLMPSDITKPELLTFSALIESSMREKELANSENPWFHKLKNISNTTGIALKDVVMPRQVDIYEAIAELDSRLQLLAWFIQFNGDSGELHEEASSIVNEYTGLSATMINGDLCHLINKKPICVPSQ